MTSSRGLALLLAALLAGCASADPQSGDTTTTREAPEYRTGSNIPVRTRPQGAEQRERAAAQAEELRRNGDSGKPSN